MGSFSRIEKTTGDKSSYELHGSGDLHLGRLLQNRRFDFAMVAFLECLKQITDFARQQDPGLDFPHQCVIFMWRLAISLTYASFFQCHLSQDCEGQNRGCLCQATIQPGRELDAGIAPRSPCPQNPTQVDDQRQQWLKIR
jgi:hypothetical protein